MALIKCPECDKEISDKALFCPGCGYPISGENTVNENVDITTTDETAMSNSDVYNQGAGVAIKPISMTYCLNCGEKLGLGSTYCMKCGYNYATGQTKPPAIDPKEAKRLKKRKSKYEKLAEFFTGEVLLIAILIIIFGPKVVTFRIATFSQIIGIVFYSINVGSKEGTHKTRSILGIIGYTIITLILLCNTVIRPEFKATMDLYVSSTNQTYEWVNYMKNHGIDKDTAPLEYASELLVLQGYCSTLSEYSRAVTGYNESAFLCERFYYSDMIKKYDTNAKAQAVVEYINSLK